MIFLPNHRTSNTTLFETTYVAGTGLVLDIWNYRTPLHVTSLDTLSMASMVVATSLPEDTAMYVNEVDGSPEVSSYRL